LKFAAEDLYDFIIRQLLCTEWEKLLHSYNQRSSCR